MQALFFLLGYRGATDCRRRAELLRTLRQVRDLVDAALVHADALAPPMHSGADLQMQVSYAYAG